MPVGGRFRPRRKRLERPTSLLTRRSRDTSNCSPRRVTKNVFRSSFERVRNEKNGGRLVAPHRGSASPTAFREPIFFSFGFKIPFRIRESISRSIYDLMPGFFFRIIFLFSRLRIGEDAILSLERVFQSYSLVCSEKNTPVMNDPTKEYVLSNCLGIFKKITSYLLVLFRRPRPLNVRERDL